MKLLLAAAGDGMAGAIGTITFYVLVGIVVIWVIVKLLKKK